MSELALPSAPPGTSLDVLVVEDDEDVREMIASEILSYGHRCRAAVDGEHAVRLLASPLPSLGTFLDRRNDAAATSLRRGRLVGR